MDGADRATSFGTVAEDYDRWRPAYPDEAVDWLSPRAPARVADVGAGTGKLTSMLLARSLDVEAVDPDSRMLAVLARKHPGAGRHCTLATALPFKDASLDAVLVADAWHWFDTHETICELRRTLRPGGWLGVVWNVAAVPVEPWEHELASDSERYDRSTKGSGDGLRRRLSYFPDEELELAQFPWVWETTPESEAAHLATTSMAIAMSPGDRAAYVEAARSALQRACDTAGRSSMPVRYEASCARWTPAQ